MPYKGLVNDKLLNFDPLDTAEKITGKDYHTNEQTSTLGLALMQAHSKDKEHRLKESCDTYFNQDINAYLGVVKDLGFLLGVEEQFTHDSKTGRYFLFWHPSDGILLSFDTWTTSKHTTHVNAGNFYYNWIPDKDLHPWISSGAADEIDGVLVWYGYHDCREALRYHITGLREHGKFVVPWKFRPLIHLGHYGVKPSLDEQPDTWEITLRDLNTRYLSMLPSEAQSLFAATDNWTTRSK